MTISFAGSRSIRADISGRPGRGLVVFAHGSGSSRHSPRNRKVAEVLEAAGFQTLLLDLLTEEEERVDVRTREHRFDIALLTDRVLEGLSWLRDQGHAEPIGLFGASTGAAAALRAAAVNPDDTKAVVSRGGRPDLAGDALAAVMAPTLLIVGGEDSPILELNQQALAELNSQSALVVVEGAGHLFEEAGALERAADMATAWYVRHLGPPLL